MKTENKYIVADVVKPDADWTRRICRNHWIILLVISVIAALLCSFTLSRDSEMILGLGLCMAMSLYLFSNGFIFTIRVKGSAIFVCADGTLAIRHLKINTDAEVGNQGCELTAKLIQNEDSWSLTDKNGKIINIPKDAFPTLDKDLKAAFDSIKASHAIFRETTI